MIRGFNTYNGDTYFVDERSRAVSGGILNRAYFYDDLVAIIGDNARIVLSNGSGTIITNRVSSYF